jgi:hypothetical protein
MSKVADFFLLNIRVRGVRYAAWGTLKGVCGWRRAACGFFKMGMWYLICGSRLYCNLNPL